MKLKLDENGNVVVQDGMPVYTYEDGTEQPFDAAASIGGFERKISNLTEEKDRFFNTQKELKEKLKAYGKIDPETAQKNYEIVKGIDEEKLVDKHGVEMLKRQWTDELKATINEEREAERTGFKNTIQDFETKLKDRDSIIYDLAVTNQFANHPYFSGEKPKTIYRPQHAAKIWGQNFDVQIDGRSYKVIAKDKNGKPLLSKKNHGEPAEFHEAIELVVHADNEHGDIFRSPGGGGPGIMGNTRSDGSPVPADAAPLDKIRAGLKKTLRQ